MCNDIIMMSVQALQVRVFFGSLSVDTPAFAILLISFWSGLCFSGCTFYFFLCCFLDYLVSRPLPCFVDFLDHGILEIRIGSDLVSS